MAALRNKKRNTSGTVAPRGGRFWFTAARAAAWALGIGLLAAGLGAAGYGLRLYFFTANTHFTLRHVQVNATGQLRTAHVIALLRDMGVEEGRSNVFSLDLRELREHLERQVLVERATVVRRLPNRLEVNIYERRPMARLHAGNEWLLDGGGHVLPPRVDPRAQALPRITGVRGVRQVKAGDTVTEETVLEALRFLHLIATRDDGHFYDVSVIQIDHALPALIVHLRARSTFRDNARIIVPLRRDMVPALDRLAAIVRERVRENFRTGFIDATYEVNVPVRP